jgi:ATP-binding cassette, subfamily C (CFTR/MRP), member 1
MGYRIAKYKLETVEVSDSRVLRMQEILLAIKLVKFYTWEKSFAKQVANVSCTDMFCLCQLHIVAAVMA